MAIPGGASGAVSGNPGAREADLAGADQKAAPTHGRRHGEKQRGGRRDGGDGKAVNNSKFQSQVRKLSFSPSSWPQMKNF